MRRIWLHNIGVFEVLPNSGNGSCLFQAISQALTCTPQHHYQVRSAVVKHMTCDKWAEKLKEFPDFWKHNIVTQWLTKERHSIIADQNQNSNNFKWKCCTFNYWLRQFVERRRQSKYNRIKRLLQIKSKHFPNFLEDFKFVFRQFMLQKHEPATRFELEAAADRFQFHFDYLQTISMKNNASHFITTCTNNFLHGSTNDIMMDTQQTFLGGAENETSSEAKKQSVPVKMAMYQFHSCRNRGCKVSSSCPTIEHFYFLHSPLAHIGNNNEGSKSENGDHLIGTLSSSSSLPFFSSGDCLHWELLIPISLTINPVPLNRQIFGLSYEIDESKRKFSTTRNGQTREIQDTVAEAIDVFIQENPEIIPRDDSYWPADDTDDYKGCAKVFKE